MNNRELTLRRIQTINGRLKQLKQAINFKNQEDINTNMLELTELLEDLQSIIERETQF
jgi:hypothetical protein